MKVLIVNRYMGLYGGAETVVKELSLRLKARGVENLIVTLNVSPEVRKLCAGCDIQTPQKTFAYKFRSSSLFSALGIYSELAALRGLVKKYSAGFDIINAHNFPAEWAAAGLKKPVVWMCNEIPDFYNNPAPSLGLRLLRTAGIGLDKFITNKFIATICVADEYNRERAAHRYNQMPEIINYGVEHDFFSKSEGQAEAVNRYKLEGAFVLLQAGMLSPEKNQLKSIEVLEALKAAIPNLKLVLAGRPQSPYDGILMDYINKKGLEKAVIFTGHISKNEVRGLYHACKIALFPVKSQGGWLAPFEALSAGRPIVVSPTMGAASIIKRENIGIVSDNFVAAIKKIHDKYGFYVTMADRGMQWVKENLTWENFTSGMLEVFKAALKMANR